MRRQKEMKELCKVIYLGHTSTAQNCVGLIRVENGNKDFPPSNVRNHRERDVDVVLFGENRLSDSDPNLPMFLGHVTGRAGLRIFPGTGGIPLMSVRVPNQL